MWSKQFYVFLWANWSLLAFQKQKKCYKVDCFSTYSLSCWGKGRLVACNMLICYGIILRIKMHYDIISSFNKEEQMILLGPESYCWTTWTLNVSDSLLLQAWVFNVYCIFWPNHYPLGRGNQLRPSKPENDWFYGVRFDRYQFGLD